MQQEVGRRIETGDSLAPVEKVVYTGSVPIVQRSQQQLLDDLFGSFAIAFVFIAVTMVILLRSLRAGLVSMIPNVFPAIVVFGAMGILGVQIEVGSMMTAAAALGIAVDDTLHFLTWFRRGLARGQSRREAIAFSYSRCATAMIQTTLICGLGLFVYVLSPFGPISRFAWLMFSMLAAALAGDRIVLPALLVGPLGRVFRPSRVNRPGNAKRDGEDCPRATRSPLKGRTDRPATMRLGNLSGCFLPTAHRSR